MISPDYLRRDNPRLLELEARYAALDLPFGHTQWKDHQYNIGLETFRSDGPYLGLGALRGEPQYRAMFDYAVSIDRYHFLDTLTEDDAFGMHTYTYDGKIISRDLCDSIFEMRFVIDLLGSLPPFWLDIGAGYGRLAHRINELWPNDVYITCVDAIPTSTFLCEFYTQYRHCNNNVEVLPLNMIDTIIPNYYGIASNIHSWSECSDKAIDFWLDKLIDWNIPYLFVTPHDLRWVSVNENGSIGNFKNNILARGWKEIATRSKYPAGVDGLYPEVNYFMFERR